jgi:hypothetical protein
MDIVGRWLSAPRWRQGRAPGRFSLQRLLPRIHQGFVDRYLVPTLVARGVPGLERSLK